MSMLTIDDLTQFRKLATKKRNRVRTSCGELVEVYSALEMCLDHIADANTMVKEDNYDPDHA